jgi:hypothetical protein
VDSAGVGFRKQGLFVRRVVVSVAVRFGVDGFEGCPLVNIFLAFVEYLVGLRCILCGLGGLSNLCFLSVMFINLELHRALVVSRLSEFAVLGIL